MWWLSENGWKWELEKKEIVLNVNPPFQSYLGANLMKKDIGVFYVSLV